jgi:type IV fimbrial biogenesis protein FimT
MNGTPVIRRARSARSDGFTLIELMVAVVIVAILGIVAVPSFRDFIIRNRTTAVTNEFVSSVLRARNEAVSRNTCTTICRSEDTTAVSPASPTCVGSGTAWGTGWIVFRNPTCDAAKGDPALDDLVMVVNALDPDYSLEGPDGSAGVIFFSATGSPRPTDAGGFLVRYQTSTRASNRTICLSSLGRTLNTTYGATCP